jgi:ribose transport system ATP-binding protein
MAAEQKELVRMENISKEFPGVKALSGVNFDVRAGEVHALVGENGAGKSTLIKVLMGVYQPTTGKLFLNGEEVHYKSPGEAISKGLGAVYQDITLAGHLTVAENFFLGHLLKKGPVIDWNKMYKISQETLNDLKIDINSKSIVRNLTIGQQEMVSIAKIIYQKANVIVFDEPTALLTNEEVEILFELIRELKSRGYGIIYISHRLEEIFALCDRVTVLKNGEYVDTLNVKDTDEKGLVSLMVGRNVGDMYGIEHPKQGDVILSVKNLTGNGFNNISFDVRAGEIFGMFGLIGAGRTETCRAIFGADKYQSGQVFIHGKEVHNRKPIEGIRNSIAFLTEDRKKEGLCLGLSVEKNINLASYPAIANGGIINLKTEKNRAVKYINEIAIKTPSANQKVQNLSGGNQQKVVIAKWLCCNSDVFIFDEPTVGVDVGAKVEIYKLIESLIKANKAVILISSYLPEVMGLSDELMIMAEGRQMGIVDKSEFYDVGGKLREEMALAKASGIEE